VGIVVVAGQPRIGVLDGNAELLVQLAAHCRQRRLSRFDLAAGKLPVAGIDLARRPLPEQKPAVAMEDDGGGDFNS
jgi:hypothetical protein